MFHKITISGVHHLRLIVTDAVRSRDFYTTFLNLGLPFSVSAIPMAFSASSPRR